MLPLEEPQGRTLRLDDLAVADDLLLRVRDVADDLLGAPLEDVVLDRVELVPDLVEDREAVVEEVVEDLVEEPAGALGEELVSEVRVLFAAVEEALDGPQLVTGQGNEVVGPDEDVELGRVQALDAAVVDREVKHDEEVAVVGVVIDLGALALREDVLHVERMPAEALRENACVERVGRGEMDPGEVGGVELSRLARDDSRDVAESACAGCGAGSARVLRGSSNVVATGIFWILPGTPCRWPLVDRATAREPEGGHPIAKTPILGDGATPFLGDGATDGVAVRSLSRPMFGAQTDNAVLRRFHMLHWKIRLALLLRRSRPLRGLAVRWSRAAASTGSTLSARSRTDVLGSSVRRPRRGQKAILHAWRTGTIASKEHAWLRRITRKGDDALLGQT